MNNKSSIEKKAKQVSPLVQRAGKETGKATSPREEVVAEQTNSSLESIDRALLRI